MSTFEKIEKAVVDGYKNIESGVVEGYKKVEDSVVGGFEKMSDSFVEKHLVKEGETVEEAKTRIVKEQAEREEKAKQHTNAKTVTPNVNVNIPNSEEIVKKSLEASMNAGKRQ